MIPARFCLRVINDACYQRRGSATPRAFVFGSRRLAGRAPERRLEDVGHRVPRRAGARLRHHVLRLVESRRLIAPRPCIRPQGGRTACCSCTPSGLSRATQLRHAQTSTRANYAWCVPPPPFLPGCDTLQVRDGQGRRRTHHGGGRSRRSPPCLPTRPCPARSKTTRWSQP